MAENSKRSRPNILIVGTPGTGKTTLAMKVCEETGLTRLDISEIVKENECYESFDDARNCHVLDEEKLLDSIEDQMNSVDGGYLIDYHGSDFFPERWFDLVVVLRTDNTLLFDRLKARGYSDKKIGENVECEIFGTSEEEARESYKQEIVQSLKSDTVEEMEKNTEMLVQWINEWK